MEHAGKIEKPWAQAASAVPRLQPAQTSKASPSGARMRGLTRLINASPAVQRLQSVSDSIQRKGLDEEEAMRNAAHIFNRSRNNCNSTDHFHVAEATNIPRISGLSLGAVQRTPKDAQRAAPYFDRDELVHLLGDKNTNDHYRLTMILINNYELQEEHEHYIHLDPANFEHLAQDEYQMLVAQDISANALFSRGIAQEEVPAPQMSEFQDLDAEAEGRKAQHKKIKFLKSTDKNIAGSMENWAGDNKDLAGSHHKFPKRTIGWLYEKMSRAQRVRLRDRLNLAPDAGPTSVARLRSNLIPWGEDKVASDVRLDDPEHTNEGLDIVHTESGRMTPRSKVYSDLALHYDEIRQRLEALEADQRMDDEEADATIGLLRKAEVLHYGIEAQPGLPADYGTDFWQRDETAQVERSRTKGRADSSKYRSLEGKEQDQMEKLYDITSEVERIDHRFAAADREMATQKNAPHSGRFKWLGKSQRFW